MIIAERFKFFNGREDDEGMSMAEIVGEPRWVTNYETEEPFTVVSFEGNFIGGEKYTLFMEIKTENGYKFGEDVEVEFCEHEYYDSYFCTPLLTEPDRLVVAFEFEAFHDWDEDKTETTPPTCSSEGSETKYCRADASHIVTRTLEKDTNAHIWGEWEIVTPADPQHEGEKMRKCKLCGETETEAISVYVMPYTKVYEPETSCVMSATIAWNADETAAETAGADAVLSPIVYYERDAAGNMISHRESASKITSGTTELLNDYYTADSNVTVNDHITVQNGATAKLILQDGVSITCKKGIAVNEGSTLIIYGQAKDSGKLLDESDSRNAGIGSDCNTNCGDIIVHGGDIHATGTNAVNRIHQSNGQRRSMRCPFVYFHGLYKNRSLTNLQVPQ